MKESIGNLPSSDLAAILQLLTKFHISDHSLKIEIGRYRNIPKEQRLCDSCKVIDNEHHFFLHCNSNKILRALM
jgi:hypothetical protein